MKSSSRVETRDRSSTIGVGTFLTTGMVSRIAVYYIAVMVMGTIVS